MRGSSRLWIFVVWQRVRRAPRRVACARVGWICSRVCETKRSTGAAVSEESSTARACATDACHSERAAIERKTKQQQQQMPTALRSTTNQRSWPLIGTAAQALPRVELTPPAPSDWRLEGAMQLDGL